MASATLGPGIFAESTREREMSRLFPPLNQLFEQQSFVLGEEFTVVDVAVGSVLAYMQMLLQLDLSDYPGILGYIKRLSERPTCQKTMFGKV